MKKTCTANSFLLLKKVSDQKIKVIVNEGEEVPTDKAKLEFNPEYTKVYQNSWMVS